MAERAERTSYNAFERFLYLFLIPCVFTLILTAVLLSLFGYNVRDSLLKAGHAIPGLSQVIPAPKAAAADNGSGTGGSAPNASLAAAQAQLAAKNAQLSTAQATLTQKDQQIKDLQTQVDSLKAQLQQKTQTDAQYQQQLQNLADIYTKMKPASAAAIMSNLAMPELVLVLNAMTVDERATILANMNPRIAAQASIEMKDTVPVKDQEIAALQARLKLNATQNPTGTNSNISLADEAKTIAAMPAKNAADMLLKMADTDQAKVISLLSAMDTPTRSSILSAMDGISAQATASIAAKLGQ